MIPASPQQPLGAAIDLQPQPPARLAYRWELLGLLWLAFFFNQVLQHRFL